MNAAPFVGIVPGLRGERRALVTPTMATTHAGGPGVLMAAWMILELELAGIVMTLYDSRTTLSAQVVEEVRRSYPDVIFQTLIPRNVRLSEAPSYGMPISRYDPTSKGGLAYAELSREVLRRIRALGRTSGGNRRQSARIPCRSSRHQRQPERCALRALL